MKEETKEIYSEVYSVLNMLGDKYIKRLPASLFNMIQKERKDSYNPIYSKEIALTNQNIKRESISMIALFHLNYWCNSDKEKQELKRIFKENEEKRQQELMEKYNPNDIFKNRINNITNENKTSTCNTDIVEYRESRLKNIINKIKNFFRKIRNKENSNG